MLWNVGMFWNITHWHWSHNCEFLFIIVSTYQGLPWVAICGNLDPWHVVLWSPTFRFYIYGVLPKNNNNNSNGTIACSSKVQKNWILHSSYLDRVPFIPIFFYQFSVLHHIFLFKCVEDIYVYILIYINPSTNQFMSFILYIEPRHDNKQNNFYQCKVHHKSHNISLKNFNFCTFDLVTYLYVLPHFVIHHWCLKCSCITISSFITFTKPKPNHLKMAFNYFFAYGNWKKITCISCYKVNPTFHNLVQIKNHSHLWKVLLNVSPMTLIFSITSMSSSSLF
jgi:hypothetical protein